MVEQDEPTQWGELYASALDEDEPGAWIRRAIQSQAAQCTQEARERRSPATVQGRG